MAVTKQELREFVRFAEERLAMQNVESLAELVSQWEAQRELEQSIAALRQSLADAEAGRVIPAETVFAEIRRKLGIQC